MTPSLLLILRSGPGDSLAVREAFDAGLVCAAFGMEVSLLLEGDGLNWLDGARLEELFEHAAPEDMHRIMALGEDSHTVEQLLPLGQQIKCLSLDEFPEVLGAHQEVLVA